MRQGILSEILLFAGNFEPDRWMFCDGRRLRSREHPRLFEVLGHAHGGGDEEFALPRLDAPDEYVRPVICVDEHAPRIHESRVEGMYAEIRLVAEAPNIDQYRWRVCDGSRLVRAQNTALYSLLGDRFGADESTYQVPTLPPPAAGLHYVIAVTGQYPNLRGTLYDAPPGQAIGEIRLWPADDVPAGWSPCNGRSLPIREYTAAFSVMGRTLGDRSIVSFELPRLAPPAAGVQHIVCVGGEFPRRWD